MLTERTQRRIDAFLDEADEAATNGDWRSVAEKVRAVLAMDPDNQDAPALLRAAEANLGTMADAVPMPGPSLESAAAAPSIPESFAAGRYQVRRFLGEGGKKMVYLAHDELLDRDVAFALIKTAGLDDVGRERILREAQAMGRMGTHPHIVSIFDFGEEQGAPYVVTELMGGGDVEGLLEKAEGPLPLERTLEIGKAVARGLVFAHAQGVVHRDLKPGNVWLTSDRVAKIGDFGLAVTEGRSRLTQHGMMVGTYGYMPPEQALGGEATAQSDLYSLGCMLYELVTGKTPFQGDSPLAVITQHLNTAAVAPSWHTNACPPPLEDLILQLMAKNPDERPTSAQAVLAVLDRIDPDDRGRSHSSDSANPLDRLARGIFVGRERELARLRGAFDEALAGHGSVVMLVGEPGVGKTRTVQELETYARVRGAQVLWGRAREAEGAPPYWPWLQVGRARGGNVDRETLRTQIGDRAAELQRLFPELRSIYPDLQEPPPVSDSAAQFRLFDAFTSLYRELSAETPILIVLDDLHWADKPTLQLLQHFAEELPRSRILVVGTYRDTELGRTHPLSEALAELNRTAGFLRVLLRGLSREEVRVYLESVAGTAPPLELRERIYEETEGNPFFLSELVNLLTQEGTLTADSVSDIPVPDGVREALGRRLDRLTDEVNEALKIASVVGRDFDLETLRLVRGRNDDLLRLLEEATAARVIEETGPGHYHFVHALMQETLLEELSLTRRMHLHGEIADALEQRLGQRAAERASLLGAHFAQAAAISSDYAAKAVGYLRIAGDAARRSTAVEEAARYYCSALALVADGAPIDPQDEAGLTTTLARCERATGDYTSSNEHYQAAIQLWVTAGDGARAARAVIEFLQNPGTVHIDRQHRSMLTRRALALVPPEDAELRGRLLATWAIAGSYADDDPDAAAAAEEAARLAEEQDLPAVRAALDFWTAQRLQASARWQEAHERGHRAYQGFVTAGDRAAALAPLINAFPLPGHLGHLDDQIAEGERFLEITRSMGSLAAMASVYQYRRGLGVLRCDWELYRSGYPPGRVASEYQIDLALDEAWREAFFGDPDIALELLPPPSAPPGFLRGSVPGARAAVLHRCGDYEGADRALNDWADVFLDLAPMFRLAAFDYAGGVLAERGARTAVEQTYAEVSRWHELRAGRLCSTDQLRGRLALRLGLVEDAEQHFRTGLEWCQRERCPVEAGRCYQGLAEVSERRGNAALAMEHLDAAGELFSKHGAKWYLEQVIARKQILKA